MDKKLAQAILRLIAILMIFAGLCLATQALFQVAAQARLLQSFMVHAPVKPSQGFFNELQLVGLIYHLIVVIWGVVLFYTAPFFARLVVMS